MRCLLSSLFLVTILAIPGFLPAQCISDSVTIVNMKSSLARQRKMAAGRSTQMFEILSRPMKPDERQALEYLFAYLPLSDLADYNGEFFLSQVRKTLQARSEMPWGMQIPEEIFLHFVLPLRVNNENLDDFRVLMYNELKQRINGMNMHDAALEINHWCHEKVTYKASDERTSSPLATMRTSFGRCGEESTFTVTALRTAGIPARQVYTPRWAHCDDNHAWVEVWVDGKWYFLGACEPEAELNMGWFAAPAMRAMLVHTRAFGWYNGTEPAIDRQEKFSELNLISNYAETKNISVKVLDVSGKPVQDATIEYQLYNYAEFYPIAKGRTNNKGISCITTGLGDLLIWATDGTAWEYRKITVESTDTIILTLKTGPKAGIQESLDLIPPVEKAPPVANLDPARKQRNAQKLLCEDSIRMAYMSTFKDSAWAVSFAQQNGLNPTKTIDFIKRSYGNWQEISEFLSSVEPGKRLWAMQLLGSISDKDLRDTKAEILLDHLENSLTFATADELADTANFSQYILSGRISNEMMLAWRGYLQQQFSWQFREACRKDVNQLVAWTKENILIDKVSNLHSRAPLSPRGVYELKISDIRSRDIFFVAVCRSFGIASRIHPATYTPQYLKDGAWTSISFETVSDNGHGKGTIRFINPLAGADPAYAINFTIGRFREGVLRTVDLDFGMKISEFPEKIELESGYYCLVTGNRQADGSVLSTLSFFDLPENQTTEVVVRLRESFSKPVVQGHIELKNFMFSEYSSGISLNAAKLAAGKGAILIWIDPDKEPSKHVMADIPAVKDLLEKWPGQLIFLLQKDRLSSFFSPSNYMDLPGGSTFAFDVNNRLMKEMCRLKDRNLEENLPLITIFNPQGDLLFLAEGYRIGIGEQLAKVVSRLD